MDDRPSADAVESVMLHTVLHTWLEGENLRRLAGQILRRRHKATPTATREPVNQPVVLPLPREDARDWIAAVGDLRLIRTTPKLVLNRLEAGAVQLAHHAVDKALAVGCPAIATGNARSVSRACPRDIQCPMR